MILNLFIVWFLTGFWHGANWTFVIWGIFYFLLLTIEKVTKLNQTSNNIVINFAKHVYTLFFIIIGWVIFRSESIYYAWQYIKVMFGILENKIYDNQTILYIKEYGIYVILGILCSMPIINRIEKFKNQKIYKITKIFIIILLFYLSMSYIVKGTYNPFIYFNF